jgi:hypothetical protein
MAVTYESSKESGFAYSGPLVEGKHNILLICIVNGQPLLRLVVENLSLNGNFIFLPKQSDYEELSLEYVLRAICPGSQVITTLKDTQSSLHTLLLASSKIDNDIPLIVANCHQYLDWDAKKFHIFCQDSNSDGVIATFNSNHPRFSYISLGADGYVEEVAEKRLISNIASCGIFYWKKGSDFVKYAEKAIFDFPEGGLICSMMAAYAASIKDGKRLQTFQCKYSWQLKFPKDLESFYRSRSNV